MPYNPESYQDRSALAVNIRQKMEECGFTKDDVIGAGEEIYSFPVKETGIRVVVYSTIEGSAVRAVGKDAIRICGVYYNESKDIERGIVSHKRVYRTGEIADIVSRMHERMREVWSSCNQSNRCHCGAPKFTSKKGNSVCADACWVD